MNRVRHSRSAALLFRWYIDRLMRKNFSSFVLLGEKPNPERGMAILMTPNHISWWDGFFVDRLRREMLPGRKLHLMMLEEQIKKYPFFNKVGAFGIDPGKPKKVIDALRYTADVLAVAENLAVVYPQGEIESQETPVLNQKGGVTKIVEYAKKEFLLMPVFFKIMYKDQPKPEIYSAVYTPLSSLQAKEYREYMQTCYMNFRALCEKHYKTREGLTTPLL